MKRSILAALATVCATVGAIVAVPPSATAAPGDDATIATARAFFIQYGVDPATQDRLIAEYQAGETWDSLSLAATPIYVEQYTRAGDQYTIDHFADGSIGVQGISGCTVVGSQHNNCKIDMWVGLVAMSFYASFNLGNNTVTNTYGAGWSIGGACGVDLIYLGRPAPNIGRMDIKAQMCGLPYSTTFWLQLTVSRGSAAVSWSP